ncbi:hypothetical protein GNI_160710 [Gregarina niphandrodes]|uniref:Uncharacterized protein n=1 Tax=Gregarina niphandrodes TaxID=110365 RepID=A0A023AYM0_GRENI|nr:hypothetical protein GNI_160710 [Gregarina niphandrodes]EZG43744.1 hypothetical protein GNI_160710 [Gregarina niphandrodes]|eukprot:XP_011133031.1 hypothetical protein GNI_160710 [Gregarina niphandrodes]
MKSLVANSTSVPVVTCLVSSVGSPEADDLDAFDLGDGFGLSGSLLDLSDEKRWLDPAVLEDYTNMSLADSSVSLGFSRLDVSTGASTSDLSVAGTFIDTEAELNAYDSDVMPSLGPEASVRSLIARTADARVARAHPVRALITDAPTVRRRVRTVQRPQRPMSLDLRDVRHRDFSAFSFVPRVSARRARLPAREGDPVLVRIKALELPKPQKPRLIYIFPRDNTPKDTKTLENKATDATTPDSSANDCIAAGDPAPERLVETDSPLRVRCSDGMRSIGTESLVSELSCSSDGEDLHRELLDWIKTVGLETVRSTSAGFGPGLVCAKGAESEPEGVDLDEVSVLGDVWEAMLHDRKLLMQFEQVQTVADLFKWCQAAGKTPGVLRSQVLLLANFLARSRPAPIKELIEKNAYAAVFANHQPGAA